MAWIEKRGTKRMVVWREADGTRSSRTLPTATAARQFKLEVELSQMKGTYTPASGRRQLVGPYVTASVAEDLALRSSTRSNQLRVIKKWILPHLGGFELGAVTEQHIRAFLASLRDAGQAPASIQKARAILSKAFSQAVRERILPFNPVANVRAPRGARRQIRILRPEEVEELARAIEPRYRALVVLAAYSGLRTGELGALRINNVDLLRRRINVVEAVSGKGKDLEVHDPKTEAGRRSVSLPDFVCIRLAWHIREYPPTDNGRIFSTEGGKHIESSTLFPAWDTARRRAGLPDVHFHDLRHTSVAFAIQQGAHPKEIQARLGHSTIAMTLDLYGHLFPGMDDELADRMDEAYRPGAGGEVVQLHG
jgi:integrase